MTTGSFETVSNSTFAADTTVSSTDKKRMPTASAVFLAMCAIIISVSLPYLIYGSAPFVTATARHIIPILSCAASMIAVVFLSRRILTFVIAAVILILTVPAASDALLPVALISFTVCCGILVSLFTVLKKAAFIIPLLVPAVSYAVSLSLTHSPALSLVSLICVIPSLAMGITTRRKAGAAQAIVSFVFAHAVQIFAAFTILILLAHSALSREIVELEITSLKHALITEAENAVKAAGRIELTASLSREISMMIDTVINCAVGIFILLSILVGYVAHRIKTSALALYEMEELLRSDIASIKPSCAAAITYFVSYILTFTSGASADPSLVAIVAQNLCLIFFPILFIVGAATVITLPKRIGFLAIAAWIGIIYFSSMSGSSIVTVLALVGALMTLIFEVDNWAKQHYSKGEEK